MRACRWLLLVALWCQLFTGRAVAAEPVQESKAPQAPPANVESAEIMPEDQSVEELTEQVKKSLAVITFVGRDGKQEGLGSGFVIDSAGLIATNRHVIGEARPLTVQMNDGKKYEVVSVHASDRLLDLAVLKIDAQGLPALPLGDSDALKQGQSVIALGNPHGLKYSVVAGVVSGFREMEGRKMIQLAIPIEPGNSGGPLLDMQGRVHGILTMKSLVTNNLGFAVTINALKPLLEKPNPIVMSRWLTIGRLDLREWQPLFGAAWRQHAGRIQVDGLGQGFGGRSLCLWQEAPPELPFELAVTVKLDDEAGAAGLVFGSDGADRHYGFYPTAGKLRLSRFEGPDVLSWRVIHDEASSHYVPGEWNTLRVRLEKDKIRCFVNGHLAVELPADSLPGAKVGLAKFRSTKAEFKQFRVAKEIAVASVSAEERAKLTKLIEDLPLKSSGDAEAAASLAGGGDTSIALLRDRAKLLEKQAEQLRSFAVEVHQQRTIGELVKLLEGKEDEVDLFHAGLLIARLDNDELDVEAYRADLRRMGDDLAGRLPKDADEKTKLAELKKFLFEENGFHGSRGDYYNRGNSYLNEVLDDREGLPITLSVVYMALARQIGLNVVGLGLPGHFCVKHIPVEGEPQIIDVYEDAAPVSRDQAAVRIRQSADRELNDDDLQATPKRMIIQRMLRNLLGVAGQGGDIAAVIRYLDAILALDPSSAQDHWMRAVAGYRAERYAAVLKDLDWLVEEQPQGIDLERVIELRRLVKLQVDNIEP